MLRIINTAPFGARMCLGRYLWTSQLYLFLEAHSFPPARLSGNCLLLIKDHFYFFTSKFTGHTLRKPYPNVHFRSTISLSLKELRCCIRRTATPGLEMLSFLKYVTESKICANQAIIITTIKLKKKILNGAYFFTRPTIFTIFSEHGPNKLVQ